MTYSEFARPVSDLGEQGLIERVTARIGDAPKGEIWSGDDAAYFKTPSKRMLATTDALVEGVDFDLSYCTGVDVGWKLCACNASDAAAMGAAPEYALVTLTLPGKTPVAFVDDLLTGILEASDRWGMHLVGGDLSGGSEIAASLTLLATPFGKEVLLRSAARPGELICVTGTLGGAAGGLFALQQGLVPPEAMSEQLHSSSGADALAVLAQKQLRPLARVGEARALVELGVRCAIDVSDGFAIDLGRVLRASSVGCEVEGGALPIHPELRFLEERAADAPSRLALALAGGEDFELLVTMAPKLFEEAQAALDDVGTPLTRVGEITDGEARIDGRALKEWEGAGWDHLRTP